MSIASQLCGISSGSWWLSSKKDPRWDTSGRSDFMSVFSMDPKAKQHIEDMKKTLGEPPDDLSYGCMKD
jgi:hypothetical protein